MATLRGAIDSIEFELEAARERADEATAEYEAMRSASAGRIDEIRAKIAVLDPEAEDEQSPDTNDQIREAAGDPPVKPAAGKRTARKEAPDS